MNSKLYLGLVPILALGLIMGSCKKDDPQTEPDPVDPYEDLYKIGEADASFNELHIALYMGEEPFMGYNYVYAVVTDLTTNEVISNCNVTYLPMMDMGSMQHSSPVEQPMWNADTLAYAGTVTFIMPSAGGTWTVSVKAENPATHNVGEAIFGLNVINKPEPKLFSFVSATNGDKIFVALVEPREPHTDMNDFDLVIYNKLDMLTFPPVSDLQISIEPEMPTMGHGSPNNVDPVSTGNGHYHGKVNFTMMGYWRVNMEIRDANGDLMYDQGYFDITFNNL